MLSSFRSLFEIVQDFTCIYLILIKCSARMFWETLIRDLFFTTKCKALKNLILIWFNCHLGGGA